MDKKISLRALVLPYSRAFVIDEFMKTVPESRRYQLASSIVVLLVLFLNVSGIVLLWLLPAGPRETVLLSCLILSSLLLLVLLIALPRLSRRMLTCHPAGDPAVDRLTGFMNRSVFGPVFEQALLDARRSLQPLSLIMIDIDRFRFINEEHGHLVGDTILTMVGDAIHSTLRASDITCRWDGNQFLIVLKECSVKDACRLAATTLERIRALQLPLNGKIVRVTTSMGVAQMLASDAAEILVARAETGLYSARDAGRDTWAIGYDWILIDYFCKPIF